MSLNHFFKVTAQSVPASAALLFMRVVAGTAFMFHGIGKIQNPFGWMGPDSATPGIFQALAAISEFGGGLAWILGLLTPLASLGIASTMAVATYTVAIVRGAPFVAKGGAPSFELPLVEWYQLSGQTIRGNQSPEEFVSYGTEKTVFRRV